MKSIKIIDLLNKIANGEEVPKKIKFHGIEYELCDSKFKSINSIDYKTIYETHLFESEWALTNNLNDEIEIIDESKKIHPLEYYDNLMNIRKRINEKHEYVYRFGSLENEQLKEIINKAIKCINDYACIDDNYNKIYSVEEKDLLKILKGE